MEAYAVKWPSLRPLELYVNGFDHSALTLYFDCEAGHPGAWRIETTVRESGDACRLGQCFAAVAMTLNINGALDVPVCQQHGELIRAAMGQ